MRLVLLLDDPDDLVVLHGGLTALRRKYEDMLTPRERERSTELEAQLRAVLMSYEFVQRRSITPMVLPLDRPCPPCDEAKTHAWRADGFTIYEGDRIIGYAPTADMAAQLVREHNRALTG